MEITTEKISDLKPHPKNPRKHPEKIIDSLCKSISEFGFTNPVLISSDNMILAGHARCKAAQKLGITEVPAIKIPLEGTKADAYVIVDNKLNELSEWDLPLLIDMIKDIEASDFDVSFTGFGADELTDLFAKMDNSEAKDDDYDVTKSLEESAFAKPGDVWMLGRHRMVCGDATKPDDVALLMDGKKANLIVTDPPYNVGFQSSNGLTIKNDKQENTQFYEFLLSSFKNMATHLCDGGSAYIFHADTEGLNFRKAFVDAGFHLSGVCIWAKNSSVMGRSPYQWHHEPILFGWLKTGKHRWYAGRAESTIWNFDKPKKNAEHPTIKPIPLLSYPIKNSCPVNGIVLDTFGGSGSTLIACEQTDRICNTMEIDPKYASVIVRRFVELSGSDGVFLLNNGDKIPYSKAVENKNE